MYVRPILFLYTVDAVVAMLEHYTMKIRKGVEIQVHTFLTLALDEVEWSASRSDRLTLV